MLAALCKVALLLVSSGLLHAVNFAPQPPPTAKDKVYRRGYIEHAIKFWVLSCGSAYTLFTVCPAIVISATLVDGIHARHAYGMLCPRPSSSHAMGSLTPGFVLGVAIIMVGTTVRLWCFKSLGRFFTFQVVVKQDHQLVTSGPYAFVRHPSYSAVVTAWLGLAVLSFVKGGYVAECGLMATQARWAIFAWYAVVFVMLHATAVRARVEDELLKEAFGEEWLQYSQRVPYRLAPGVY